MDTKGNKVTSALQLTKGHRIDATTKTLVTLSENELNIKGIPVKLPYGEYTPPKIFYLNNTLYFSTTDTSSQKVYLFYSNGETGVWLDLNTPFARKICAMGVRASSQKVYLFYSNGEAVEGFPVYGKSAVDISNSDKDKALEMVVATEDNSILIYEIN